MTLIGCSDDYTSGAGAPPTPWVDNPDYIADTLAVRAILDSNSLYSVSVGSVTTLRTGRVSGLDISGWSMRRIPPQIGNLTGLQTFYAYNNLLTGLPSQLGNLRQLRSLKVHNNELKGIPRQIGSCTLLVELYLTGNNLQTVPAELASCARLGRLELARNQLVFLPPALTALDRVSVSVGYNRLCECPDSVAGWLDAVAVEGSGWRESQTCE